MARRPSRPTLSMAVEEMPVPLQRWVTRYPSFRERQPAEEMFAIFSDHLQAGRFAEANRVFYRASERVQAMVLEMIDYVDEAQAELAAAGAESAAAGGV